MERRKELVAAGAALAASTAATTTATGAGTTATTAATVATGELAKTIKELVAEQKKARDEAGLMAAPEAAGAVMPMGPPAPMMPDFGTAAAEQVDLVQSEYARLIAASSETANLLRLALGGAFDDMAPYALRFGDTFIDTFEMMQAAGKNVFSSLVKSFANAMLEMIKMAIQSAIARIIIEKTAAIAIASIEGFFTFGAALLKIAPVIAIAAGAIAALGGMQKKLGMYTGGVVKQTGMILAHAGERVINPAYNTTRDVVDMLSGTRLAAAVSPVASTAGGAGGVAAAPIYFHMPIYGPVSSELDLEKIMRKAADVFRASHGG
jgi:hypothetical protein